MAVGKKSAYLKQDDKTSSALHFADRVPEATALADGLSRFRHQVLNDEIDGEHFDNVITFWGVGGAGKTELSKRLRGWLNGAEFDCPDWGAPPSFKTVTVRWDLEKLHHGVDVGGFLLDLRKALTVYQDRWYSFDLALGALLTQLRVSNEGEHAAASDEVLEWVSTVVQDFGLFGSLAKLSTVAIQKVVREVRQAKDEVHAAKLQPQLSALVDDILVAGDVATEQPRLVDEILGLLIPEMEQLPRDRPVLVVFIDTFERVQSSQARLVQERLVNRVVGGLPYAFFVVTGRNLVRWHDPERVDLHYFGPHTWPCLTRTDAGPEPRQHRVGNLSTEDGIAVLRPQLLASGLVVSESDLRSVVQSTKGLPIHLEAVANLARNLRGTEELFDPALLMGTLPAVVQRLLEHLDATQRRLFHAAAVLPFVSTGLLADVAEVEEGAAETFVRESLVRDSGSRFFPYALHEEIRAAVRNCAPCYQGGWAASDWSRAALRCADHLHDRFEKSVSRDALEERMHVHAAAVMLCLECGIKPQWVIDEVALTPSYTYLMRLLPPANLDRLDNDLHGMLALFQAVSRQCAPDDPVFDLLERHATQAVRRRSQRWRAYRFRNTGRYESALPLLAALKDLPDPSEVDVRQYGVTLRMLRRFADAQAHFAATTGFKGAGAIAKAHGRIADVEPVSKANWQRGIVERKSRRWVQELKCFWVGDRVLLDLITADELQEFLQEGRLTERIVVQTTALEGLALLDLHDPARFASIWEQFEDLRRPGSKRVAPLSRMRLALLYLTVHSDPRYVEQLYDELGTYNLRSSEWIGIEFLLEALGYPVIRYETQWLEPVEVVRDRWLSIFSNLACRALERRAVGESDAIADAAAGAIVSPIGETAGEAFRPSPIAAQ